MPVKNPQRLAAAAALLCSAYDELTTAGYDGWTGEIRVLIDIIDAELEWLRDQESCIRLAGS